MSQTITVVYEDGVLKPLQKVDFKEHQQFEVDVKSKREINIPPQFAQQVDRFIEKYRPALEELAKR
ncbi:MAG: antitoxin family protein [bacterium]|nr:antitoxin family protein [bacterium]